jgi:hypothetical protein
VTKIVLFATAFLAFGLGADAALTSKESIAQIAIPGVPAHVCVTLKGTCNLLIAVPIGYPCTCTIGGEEVHGTTQ